MKKYLLSFLCLILCGQIAFAQDKPADWAGFKRYAEANATAPQGAAAVFLGNSITDAWPGVSPEFFAGNNYIGRGIGGQVSSQMLVRMRRDVIDLHPRCVVILAGTNDVAQNQGYISVENTFGNIVSMAELARANGIKVVICSVLPAFDFSWRPGLEPATKILAINALLKEYAAANGIAYADYHTAMKDDRDGLPEKYSRDGVHPNKEGYAIMESIIKPIIDKTVAE